MARKAGKKEDIGSELKRVEKTQKQILRRLDEEEALERTLLSKLKRKHRAAMEKVEKFTFADFGQVVVGAAVFGIPSLWTPDFWNFLQGVPTFKLLVVHVFLMFCVIVTLNYAFRKTFRFNLKFLEQLFKRFFYIYLTVLSTVVLLLWSFNKLVPDMSTLEFIRFLVATHSIGMVGAVTFDFIVD